MHQIVTYLEETHLNDKTLTDPESKDMSQSVKQIETKTKMAQLF